MPVFMRSTLLAAVAAAYLCVLVDVTLVRFPQPGPRPNLVPLRTVAACVEAGGRSMAVNLLGNLLLLAPVGMWLPLARPGRIGPGGVLMVGLGMSGAIELVQYGCGHRTADVDDVLLNTAGTLIGYAALVASRVRAGEGSDRRAEDPAVAIGPEAGARPAR